MVKNLYKLLVVSLISTALLACGGTESDSKLKQSQDQSKSQNFSGIALDGYLYNARVCLDKNNNFMCDPGDGVTATTDARGRFRLEINNNDDSFPILVEAIAGLTIDMDKPNQTIDTGFIFKTPISNSNVISPITSLINSISKTSGISFDSAAELVADELGINKHLALGDYSASVSVKNREIHMLARGLTRVLQVAQKASLDSGIDQGNARKGVIYKLAGLDLAEFKAKTDLLSHGASATSPVLEQLGKEYRDQLKVYQKDIDDNKIIAKPPAPKHGQVNDTSDTFNWQFVRGFDQNTDYEYSLDSGKTWSRAIRKPIVVGNKAFDKGMIQVRVAASSHRNTPASTPVLSDKAYTLSAVPSAPAWLTVNDASNEFDWAFIDSFIQLEQYEYSLDNGLNWIQIIEKPQKIQDIDIPAGHLKIRLAKDNSQGRPASLSATSTSPMTKTPVQPEKPILLFANDRTNKINWLWVTKYTAPSFYEINLGNGWKDIDNLPYDVGNVSLPANTISIRVKSNSLDARPAGIPLIIGSTFTRSESQSSPPTLPIVDDAENTFGWTDIEGFEGNGFYEYSLDSGITFHPTTSNPQPVPDEEFFKGQVCVRVKAESYPKSSPGETLCSDKVYSVTPAKPAAPTSPISDDGSDTFDWMFVNGFSEINDYEINILDTGWVTVTQKPYPLNNQVYAVNSVQVRVKSNLVTGRPSGLILSNSTSFTLRPSAPNAPTNLVVNDTDNTLDWSYFSEFTQPEDFEVTLDSGSTWTRATTKPIVIGNIDKNIAEIQLRVAQNFTNGMPHGPAILTTEAFTKVPEIPAPTSPQIMNTFTGDKQIKTNGFKWDYLTTKIDGQSIRFDKPQYYEFTNNKGITWLPVISNPQFIGPEAYDKANVGIRLKAHAKENVSNLASQPLWAIGANSRFTVIKFVPLLDKETTVSFNYLGDWNSFRLNCIAEYDDKGQGEPIFWSKKLSSGADNAFDKVSALDNCGITDWKLPSHSKVITLSTRDPETLPKNLKNYLISYSAKNIWANKSGTPVTINQGKESLDQWVDKYIYPVWQLPSGTQLLTEINSSIAAVKTLLSEQNTAINNAELYLTSWLSANQSKSKSYTALEAEVQAKIIELKAMIQPWRNDLIEPEAKLKTFEFLVSVGQSRIDIDSLAFINKVKAHKKQVIQLKSNIKSLAALLVGAEFAEKLAFIQQKSVALTRSTNALTSAPLAEDIHQASLNLYSTISDLEHQYHMVNSFINKLNESTKSVGEEFASLNTLFQTFVSKMNATTQIHDLIQSKILAKDGLKLAKDNGYSVSQLDATVSDHFAKLDELGNYLPKSTTYQQGWRCVEDTRIKGKRRVWTLLNDGRPNGNDELAYAASASGLASVLGSNGLLENTNNANLCGFSDWKIPALSQLLSLQTKTISSTKETMTIDTDAFPHHRGLDPKYDKPINKGGIIFYYWSNQSKDTTQYITNFSAKNSDQDVRRVKIDGIKDTIIFARLVREKPSNYQYLNMQGKIVTERQNAICAQDIENNLVWQLFTNGDKQRFKKYVNITPLIATRNAQAVCAKKNWRYPTKAELYNLLPGNSDVFKFNKVAGGSYSNHNFYITSDLTYFDRVIGLNLTTMDEANVGTHSNDDKYLYRLVAE